MEKRLTHHVQGHDPLLTCSAPALFQTRTSHIANSYMWVGLLTFKQLLQQNMKGILTFIFGADIHMYMKLMYGMSLNLNRYRIKHKRNEHV